MLTLTVLPLAAIVTTMEVTLLASTAWTSAS